MPIPFNEFEQYVDEIILERGLYYFESGRVNEPAEISPGVYQASVEGTADYTVRLNIENGKIIFYHCNCPYDMGPICKHVVAVIYYLQKNLPDLKKKSSVSKSNAKEQPGKQKTVKEQVNELLDLISHEELKRFICEKTEQNSLFQNMFMSAFAHLNSQESKDLYINQVKSILQNAADHHGFIDWSASHEVGEAVSELLTSAQHHYENKNYRSAIFICIAVMEQMTNALQFGDDSNGDYGGNIDLAYQILQNIREEELPEKIRKQLFDYCLWAYDRQIYAGWDWHLGMLEIASEIFQTDKEARQILSQIEKTQGSEYSQEIAQSIKYSILKKTRSEQEANDYLEKNLANPLLRREYLTKAIRHKEYEKAISIARDGINHDMKNKPGLAMEWYDWLLKIARAQNDAEKIIEYSRLLFIDNFRHEYDYYQILKRHVQPEKWDSFMEEMIKEINSRKRWLDSDLIAGIYIKEEWWDRLLEHLKINPTLSLIEHYEKYLLKDYSEEIAHLYSEAIISYIKDKTGRKHYQAACRYLKRMIRLGARTKVDELIKYFRANYPQRRAFMEELKQV